MFGPVFRGLSPEIDPGTPLDRPGAPRTSICTKNHPRGPILSTFRDNSGGGWGAGGARRVRPPLVFFVFSSVSGHTLTALGPLRCQSPAAPLSVLLGGSTAKLQGRNCQFPGFAGAPAAKPPGTGSGAAGGLEVEPTGTGTGARSDWQLVGIGNGAARGLAVEPLGTPSGG